MSTLFIIATFLYFLGMIKYLLYLAIRNKLLFILATAMIFAGFVVETSALIQRSMETGHGPYTNLFEYCVFLAWVVFGVFLIAGWYLFPYLFVVDKDMDFWPAMEASREIGFRNHMSVFLISIIIAAIYMVGALAALVGLLVSIPYSFCIIATAYEHQVGSSAAVHEGAADDVPPPPPPPPPPAPIVPS